MGLLDNRTQLSQLKRDYNPDRREASSKVSAYLLERKLVRMLENETKNRQISSIAEEAGLSFDRTEQLIYHRVYNLTLKELKGAIPIFQKQGIGECLKFIHLVRKRNKPKKEGTEYV